MSAAIDRAAAVLAGTIERCVDAWQDAWDRAPTARELVHAFELVLGATPDDRVADPAAVATMSSAPPPPPPEVVKIQRQAAAPGEVDTIDLWLRDGAGGERGDVRCVVDEQDGVLVIDYWGKSPQLPPLVLAAVAPAWREAHPDRSPTRARLRAFDTLADPVDLPLEGS